LIGICKRFLVDQKLKNKFLGTKAFICAAMKNATFAIYVTPIYASMERSLQDILFQYQDFKDVFEKKNVSMLNCQHY